jgi:hydroxyethylthiazole kinase-like uncharacterized protein yjeF
VNSLRELLDHHPLPDGQGSKDDKGTLFIIGGPPACPGAAVLAATAALRSGAGRVQLAVHSSVAAHVGIAVPEVAVIGWDQHASPPPDAASKLEHADAVVVGSGHTDMNEIVIIATANRLRADSVLVLDAGALHAATRVSHRPLVVAPNPSEAARMLNPAEPDGDADEELLARRLTERLGQPVAVRGAVTVLADAEECWLFSDHPTGLGTPGSGDVFIGVLGALLSTGVDPVGALAWAVVLHADAAASLAKATPVGYLASDVVRELPFVRATLSSPPTP